MISIVKVVGAFLLGFGSTVVANGIAIILYYYFSELGPPPPSDAHHAARYQPDANISTDY